MGDLDFRSDVSMQDVDVPELVLLYLVPKSSTVAIPLPIPAPDLEQTPYESKHAAGSQVSRMASKIKCRQEVHLDQPVPILSIGSDPSQCGLVLDRCLADPVHCRVYAQLNSGFDVWIIEDNSTNGTFYRSRKDDKSRLSIGQADELETEEIIFKGSKAVQGLRYLRIGPYEFDCLPSEVNNEVAERERWFRRHEPLPVTSQMFITQLAGRPPNTQIRKNIGEGGFGEVFKSMEMQTGLLVAVKKQKVGNGRGVESVRREIQSMRDLRHQNVVKILLSYESNSEEGLRVFHLVMPLYSCCLRQALPKMKFESKRNAMIQMVQGLKYIHSNGFLHRDIKPENIFISERIPTNIVLGDLGLLSPVGAIGRGAGTNIYKVPEVEFDLRQSSSIDIYALGITILQMLDSRATKGGWHGLEQWVEDLWDHPPPPPFSYLIIQMTAPYPHTLRPSLDTIQHFLLQNKDLPESVERPKLNLKETMRMLEKKHASSARPTPQILTAVPTPQPALPQPQVKPTKSRLDPRINGLGARVSFEKPVTKKAGPLDLVHKARGHAPQGPPVPAQPQLKSPDSERTPPGSILTPVRSHSSVHSSTQGVDFTKACPETGNIFSKQKLELLDSQLKARWCMLEKQPTDENEAVTRGPAGHVASLIQGSGPRAQCTLVLAASPDYRSPPLMLARIRALHLRPVTFSSTTRATVLDVMALDVKGMLVLIVQREQGSSPMGGTTKMLQGLTQALRAGAGEVRGRLTKSIRWMLGL